MKLFGNSKNAKHSVGRTEPTPSRADDWQPESEDWDISDISIDFSVPEPSDGDPEEHSTSEPFWHDLDDPVPPARRETPARDVRNDRDEPEPPARRETPAPQPEAPKRRETRPEPAPQPARREPPAERAPEKPKKPKKEKRGALPLIGKILVVIICILLVLIAAFAAWFVTQVKPPEHTAGPNEPLQVPNTPTDTNDPAQNVGDSTGDPSSTGSNERHKYTFLAVGMDDGNGNTDTIMVATFDTDNYTLDVLSIPRDTLAYVNGKSRRVNTLYALGGADGILDGIADMVGYRPDFYGIINLNAFIKLIDGIGGVDYYVQQDMDYDDPAQDLSIHFTKGMHHLYGQEAMEFCRFRKGYADQDIGRIHAQQDFLLTAAKQILEESDELTITTLVSIFMNDVKTDLTAGECTWFAKELLKLDFENINFYTVPGNYNDYIDGNNYVTIDVDGLLEIVNEHLNPFDVDITTRNLDIRTRDADGDVYNTRDRW